MYDVTIVHTGKRYLQGKESTSISVNLNLDFSTMFLVHNSPETKFLVYLKLSVNETQVSTVIPHRRMYPT